MLPQESRQSGVYSCKHTTACSVPGSEEENRLPGVEFVVEARSACRELTRISQVLERQINRSVLPSQSKMMKSLDLDSMRYRESVAVSNLFGPSIIASPPTHTAFVSKRAMICTNMPSHHGRTLLLTSLHASLSIAACIHHHRCVLLSSLSSFRISCLQSAGRQGILKADARVRNGADSVCPVTTETICLVDFLANKEPLCSALKCLFCIEFGAEFTGDRLPEEEDAIVHKRTHHYAVHELI